MLFSVGIDQVADHGLVGGIVTLGLLLKKLNAFLGEFHRYADGGFLRYELLWGRQKVIDNSDFANRLCRVRCCVAHRTFAIFAIQPLQKFGLSVLDR